MIYLEIRQVEDLGDNMKSKEYLYIGGIGGVGNEIWSITKNEHIFLNMKNVVITDLKESTQHEDCIGEAEGVTLGYDFTVKDTGERWQTPYKCMIVENSPENLQIIEEICKKKEEMSKVEIEYYALFNKLKTLENSSLKYEQ